MFSDNLLLGLRKSLFLLGAFSIGYNLSMAIHELGHATAMWATGGYVTRITLNPFSRSFTYYGSTPTYPLLTAWAGVGISAAIGLLALAGFRNAQGSWTLPNMMTGLCAIIVGGLYLTVDAAILSGGDATYIILYGTPRLLVISAGVCMIILGLVVGYLLLPRMGLTSDNGILSRLAILEVGVGSYLIAMLIYQIQNNRGGLMEWLIYVLAGLLILAAIAVGSTFLERWRSVRYQDAIAAPTWSAALVALLIAAVVLAVELLAFDK